MDTSADSVSVSDSDDAKTQKLHQVGSYKKVHTSPVELNTLAQQQSTSETVT